MIASLRGRLSAEDAEGLVVEVGGVGLRVHASAAAAGRARTAPDLVTLQTELVVREDALTLYGFADQDERDLFNLLRGVTGVGPRIALAILSLHPPAVVRRAIVDGDIAQLTRVSGVGRKLAERLALELREKVGTPGPTPVAAGGSTDGEYRAAHEALVSLGFTAGQADEGLADSHGDADARLRSALAILGAAR
jgi:Holliday junction DNA helicase RuvA